MLWSSPNLHTTYVTNESTDDMGCCQWEFLIAGFLHVGFSIQNEYELFVCMATATQFDEHRNLRDIPASICLCFHLVTCNFYTNYVVTVRFPFIHSVFAGLTELSDHLFKSVNLCTDIMTKFYIASIWRASLITLLCQHFEMSIKAFDIYCYTGIQSHTLGDGKSVETKCSKAFLVKIALQSIP